jgi:hypothetical protein
MSKLNVKKKNKVTEKCVLNKKTASEKRNVLEWNKKKGTMKRVKQKVNS